MITAVFLAMVFLSCSSNLSLSNSSVFTNNEASVIRQLSYYCSSLRNTPGDTGVYVLDSGELGANMLLVAGTHGNETAGIHAAELFVNTARVEKGCVFVIPRLNNSGITAGTRLVQSRHQEQPDFERYTPPEGVTQYAGMEQRNINRSYPGTEQAGLAQKIALAVMHLLITENIAIAIDMHEAKPDSDMAWNIVSHPKNVNIAALTILDLEEKGISMYLEVSPSSMDGLSHKEWGNRSRAMSFLIETVNPAQADYPSIDKLHDPCYALNRRVAIQLEVINTLVFRSNEVLSAPLMYTQYNDHSQSR